MRDGALASPPNLQLLQNYFVSTWALVSDLEIMKSRSPPDLESHLAESVLKDYNFPVESLVVYPDGTVVHHINANTLLDFGDQIVDFSILKGFHDPVEKEYHNFLKEALRRTDSFLQESEKRHDEL